MQVRVKQDKASKFHMYSNFYIFIELLQIFGGKCVLILQKSAKFARGFKDLVATEAEMRVGRGKIERGKRRIFIRETTKSHTHNTVASR